MLHVRLIALLTLLIAPAAFAAERPNIVVILADDMGWGDLSCYPKGTGYDDVLQIPTPHIDAIAAGGVQCMQGYTTGMVCAPSRAGLLSGQFQARWGYYGFEESIAPIPRDIKLLPEVLRDAGYATALIGKWHVSTDPGSLPLRRGFERFFGFLGGQHDYFYASLGQTFHGVGNAPDAHVFDQDQPSKGVKYLTEEFTDRAIEFMGGAKKAGKPFFLYLPYNSPHGPMQVPWADLEPIAKGQEKKKLASRDLVRAMVINLDQHIGRLTQWLRENGLEQNTIVVFSSDNGGSDGGPGKRMAQHNGGLRGRKSTFYDGGTRVPYIVRWPTRLPAGKKYDRPVSQVDIFATALAASGAAPPSGLQRLDGVDLVPYLTGEKTDRPHQRLFWTKEGPDARKWAVRDGDMKLIMDDLHPETMGDKKGRVATYGLQLYDLAADPMESKNLVGSRPEDVKRLQAMYDEFMSHCKPTLYVPDVEARHKAALAARAKDSSLESRQAPSGSPGRWLGKSAGGRVSDGGVLPPLPELDTER